MPTTEPFKTTLGQAIRRLRIAKGLKQRILASNCGITPAAISQIEHGKTNPSLSSLIKITKTLDPNPKSLLFEACLCPEDQKTPSQ